LVPTGPDPHGMGRWCAAMDTLQNTHPLTRAAAAFALWRGMGLSDLDTLLEPGVIAARVAAAGARGGLSSVPLSDGAPRLGQAGGHAPMRLENWLLAVAETAAHAQMQLDRLEAWHARAIDRAVEMKGKGAPALLAFAAARPVLSARDVAKALTVTPVQARTLLNRLEALGLLRELTGNSRFRFWTAAL
ncbi:MAG: helix-turn-helix domain-containing protein, partial [Pseudomonadota bacterium]